MLVARTKDRLNDIEPKTRNQTEFEAPKEDNKSHHRNKNLGSCAQLLTNMLRQAPGTLYDTKDQKKAKQCTNSGLKAKSKPNLATKCKRFNARGTKPLSTPKQFATRIKLSSKKEHVIDSISETSTELQVRLAGPKPSSLNNSETVTQIVPKEPDPVPRLSKGHMVLTKAVPSNDRILSSTPMSSPKAKSRQQKHHTDKQDGLHFSSGLIQDYLPKHQGLAQQHHLSPNPQLSQPQCPTRDYSLHSTPRTETGISGSGCFQEKSKASENQGTLAAIHSYITSSATKDDVLSSFLKSYLVDMQQAGINPSSKYQTASAYQEIQHQTESLNQHIPQNRNRGNYASQSDSIETSLNQNKITPSSTGPAYQNIMYNTASNVPSYSGMTNIKPLNETEINIDDILKNNGIVFPPNAWSNVTPQITSPGLMPTADMKETLTERSQYLVNSQEAYASLNPSQTIPKYNPQQTLYNQSITTMPAIQSMHTTTGNLAEGGHQGNANWRDVAAEDKENHKARQEAISKTEGAANHKSPRNKNKSSHKDKDKKRDVSKSKVTPAVLKNKSSPGCVKTQVRTLLYLFGELRAVSSMSKDTEVNRLLNDIEKMLVEISPGLSNLSAGTDLDLALQPLRSENAHLRRRIRILTQQSKDKCQSSEDASKQDSEYEVVHLELQRHSLETQLKEEQTAREKLQAALASLAAQIKSLMQERQSMIQVLATKENDHMKSQQDWVGEANRLRTQLSDAEKTAQNQQKKIDSVNNEITLRDISLKEKNQEIGQLQKLVKDLQGSMSKLLNDLKGDKLNQSLPAVDDISFYIKNIDSLLSIKRPKDTDFKIQPTRESGSSSDTHPPETGQAKTSQGTDFLQYSSPLEKLMEAIPSVPVPETSDVQDGLQRAYKLLDCIDEAMSPLATAVQAGPSQTQKMKNADDSKRPAQKSPKKTETGKREPVGEVFRTQSKVSSGLRTDFDPEHDDYQGKLTQALLMEHDRQNGPDDEIIERMLKRSQRSEHQHVLSDNGSSKRPSSDLSDKTGNNDSKIEKMSRKENLKGSVIDGLSDTKPKCHKFDGESDKLSGFTGILSPRDLDVTEYMNPPERTEILGKAPSKLSGPTVKEILAPIANRMMKTNVAKKTHMPKEIQSESTSESITSETEFDGEGEDLEGDSTLKMDDVGKSAPTHEDNDISRYSLTDYFKKYHKGQTVTDDALNKEYNTNDRTNFTKNHQSWLQPSNDVTKRNSSFNQKPFSPMSFISTNLTSDSGPDLADLSQISFSLSTSSGFPSKESSPIGDTPKNVPLRKTTNKSPQDRLYTGTELDTSLSTIQEAETNSNMTASSVTSVTSLASVDEFEFKEGLAKLDANIARIQQSLQKSTSR